jgi:hypothetical protein
MAKLTKKQSEEARALLSEIDESPPAQELFRLHMPRLLEVGYGPEQSLVILRAPVRRMVFELAGLQDVGEETDIGSKWFDEQPAETVLGAKYIDGINLRFKSLTKIGVTAEDVKSTWDRSAFARYDMYFRALTSFHRGRMRAQEHVAKLGSAKFSLDQIADSTALRISLPGEKVLLGGTDDLPLEAYERALSALFAIKEKIGDDQFSDLALEHSMTGLARQFLLFEIKF